MQEVSYYAVIPAEVRYDQDLTANAKLLYGEITALCNKHGHCWATNEYFAGLYNVSHVSVSKWVNALIQKGYIKSEITFSNGDITTTKRYLSLVKDQPLRKVKDPLKEKFKQNTTINNTSIYNTPAGKVEDEYTTKDFLKRWSDARKHYDKKPTHIERLNTVQRGLFNELLKYYSPKQFDKAINGLFSQKTYPQVRVNPTHFLENFEQYLTCGETGEKLFETNKKNDKTGML